MSARDGFEHGVPCWVARVGPGAEAARGFYAELLGWDSIEAMPGQYLCRLRDRSVAAIVEEPSVPPGWQT